MSGCHNPGNISYAPMYGKQCYCQCHYDGGIAFVLTSGSCCSCRKTIDNQSAIKDIEISSLKRQIKSLLDAIEKIKSTIKELTS